jgi:hypothetical protein
MIDDPATSVFKAAGTLVGYIIIGGLFILITLLLVASIKWAWGLI